MGWWHCSAGPKAFPSNQTLLIKKWKAFLLNVHLAPKQVMGTGEAQEKQVPSGAPCFQMQLFVSPWWTLMAQTWGSSTCSSLTLYLPLLCSFLPLSNPKYLVFSPFSTLAQYTSAFPPLPMRGSLPLHASPPPILHPFALVSSACTFPPRPFTLYIHVFLPPCSLPLSSSFFATCQFQACLSLCAFQFFSSLMPFQLLANSLLVFLSLSLFFPFFSLWGTQACLSPFVSGMPLLWVFRHLQVCLFLSSHPSLAV